MSRQVRREGKLVDARMRDLYLTSEEWELLAQLSHREGKSQGEFLGGLLRNAKVRADRLDDENAKDWRLTP